MLSWQRNIVAIRIASTRLYLALIFNNKIFDFEMFPNLVMRWDGIVDSVLEGPPIIVVNCVIYFNTIVPDWGTDLQGASIKLTAPGNVWSRSSFCMLIFQNKYALLRQLFCICAFLRFSFRTHFNKKDHKIGL